MKRKLKLKDAEYERLIKLRIDIDEKIYNSKTVEEMDELYKEYIKVCNELEEYWTE